MRNPWIGQDEQSLTLLCPYPYSFSPDRTAVHPYALRFCSGQAFGVRVVVGALQKEGAPVWIRPLQPGFRPLENKPTSLPGDGKAAPFGGWRHHLPPRKRWDNKAPRSCILISCSKQSTGCCAPAQRGGKETGFVGSLWATENPVTRFPPGQRWCRRHQKGGSHRRWLIQQNADLTDG